MATTIGSSWTNLVTYNSTYSSYIITYRLYAKYSASSTVNNTHTVQLKWTTQKTSGGTGVYDNDSTTPKVTNISGGSSTLWTGSSFTIPSGSAVAETDRTTSGDITITHDSNGSYAKTWSWSLSHVYAGGSASGTVEVTLPTIPRASSFSLSSNSITTIGSTTATITRADSSFTHNITTTYSGTTYTLASGVGTSASLTIPTGLRSAMKSANAKSASLTLTLTTYSGTTAIGTATTSLTVSAPAPTLTLSATSVACNANITWTIGNMDTSLLTYTVQRLYNSAVVYTDMTKGTTASSAVANATFQTKLTSATSGTVTTTVTYYAGTTTVGSVSKTYTVTIPTGTYYWKVSNGTTTYKGGYVSGKSIAGLETVTQTFTCASQGSSNSSTVSSYTVTCSNSNVSLTVSKSSNTITVVTGTLPASASNYTFTLTCTITDTRGTSSTVTTSAITATGYQKPKVSGSATRVNSSGTADSTGQYAKLTASATATTATMSSVVIKYGSTTVASGTSSASASAYGGSFSLTTQYTFTVTATDSFGQTTTYTLILPKAKYEFSLYPGGGAGFGFPAKSGAIDSAYNYLRVRATSTTAGPHVTLDNSTYRIGLHIGTGGTNRGIYDFNTDSDGSSNSGLNKWLIYTNNTSTYINPGTSNIILNGATTISGTATVSGNIVSNATNTRNLGTSSNVWANVYATTFVGALSGNATTATSATSATTATTATNATNSAITNQNPSSSTWYYPTWVAATSGNRPLYANDGFRVNHANGTADTVGQVYLQLGNGTASGTAGNKRGYLQIYASTAYYTQLQASNNTAHRTYTFPNKANGTVALEPVSLYSDSTGTTGNVTLSESAANFSYLDIYYYTSHGSSSTPKRTGHTRVYSPNNAYVALTNAVYWSNELLISQSQVSIITTTITRLTNEQAQFKLTTSAASRTATTTNLYIYRVDGIR